MPEPADWVAQTILAHLNTLADQARARSAAQIPWYQAQSPDLVREMFVRDFQALARVLDTNDNNGLRIYTEQACAERISRGAPAAALISGATLIEDVLGPLLYDQAPGPPQAAEATRRVQSVTRNIRMILSAINLQLVNQPPAARRS
jgi:hypothetical protein